jgi:hypothetical protein|tara:strand:- start:1047 stop:1727 length:681 start_codon:yes stop_codon:yes gene_type:complete
MKIHIYYRHYNIQGTDNRNRPSWFDYEKCYHNLVSSLKGGADNFRLNVVYDGNEPNWIKRTNHDSLTEIQSGGDFKSFQQTCEIVKNDSLVLDGDLVYFLENDYMHVNGWLDKATSLFMTYEGLDYVSLYDHNDKYFLPMYDGLTSKIFTTPTHHWKSTPSTCGSFIMTKERFNEDYDILSTMEGDHNKWLWLNKHRSRSVITPIPGLSTHCVEGLLSPTIKWDKI